MVIQQHKNPNSYRSLQRQMEHYQEEREAELRCQQTTRLRLHRLLVVLTVSASVLLGNILFIINLVESASR